MKTIFFVLPRRVSVRYMISTGLLDDLIKSNDLRVIILTSIKDPEFIREFSESNIIIENISLRDGDEYLVERFCRILKNYILGIVNFETFKIKAILRGKLFFYLYCFAKAILRPFIFLRKFCDFVDVYIFSKLFDKKYEKIFSKYSPDLIVIHSVQELAAVPVSRVAKRKNIEVLGIVLSWDNLTNKSLIYCYCDKLIVWNQIMKDQAIKYHKFSGDNIFITGTPQFDYYVYLKDKLLDRETFWKNKGIDPNKNIIIQTTVPFRIGGDSEIKSIRAITKAIKNNKLENTQFLIRVYTRDDQKRYEEFKNVKNVFLDFPINIINNTFGYRNQDINFTLDLMGEMKYSDIVINIASTTSIDAAIFDKPVINIAFGRQKFWHFTTHFKSILKTNGTTLVYSEEELIDQINKYFENKNINTDNRQKIVDQIAYKVDGCSHIRINNIILNNLKK